MKKYIFLITLLGIANTVFSQEKIENLNVTWPEEYKWKVGNSQEDKTMHFMELVPGNESIDKWSIIGTMMSLKNVHDLSMNEAVKLFHAQTKAQAPDAKLTVLEKNETVKNPWVLFKIEVEKYLSDAKPESQLYYIIQGDSSLFVTFVGIKEKEISKKFEEQWSNVFKTSKLVYL